MLEREKSRNKKLLSQLDKARAEKDQVEEQLGETQLQLQLEQREHKQLALHRVREAEQWSDEREKSLSLVEEMTREVTTIIPHTNLFLLAGLLLRFHSSLECLQLYSDRGQKYV